MSSIGRYKMEEEDKTRTELIKELKIFKEERGEWLLNNISECKEVEEELLNLETLFKIIFENVPEAYYISDLKGNFVDANRATERITGYKKEELIEKDFFKLNLFNLTDILKVAKILLKNKIGMTTGPDGFTLNRKDKRKVTVELSTYPAKFKEKKLVLGILEDINEYRKMQKEINIYKEYLEELVNGRTSKLKRANDCLQKDIGNDHRHAPYNHRNNQIREVVDAPAQVRESDLHVGLANTVRIFLLEAPICLWQRLHSRPSA